VFNYLVKYTISGESITIKSGPPHLSFTHKSKKSCLVAPVDGTCVGSENRTGAVQQFYPFARFKNKINEITLKELDEPSSPVFVVLQS
jgi:hypothetical protein